MQRKKATSRRSKLLGACLAAALVAVVLGVYWQFSEAWQATYWKAELGRCEEQDAQRICRRLAGLGEAGLAALIRAMAETHGRAAEAAYLTLDGEIELAERGPALEASSRLTRLAEVLAGNVGRLPTESQQHAAQLAMKILLSQKTREVVDGGRLAGACDRTLRAVRHRPAIASAIDPNVAAKTKASQRPQTPEHHPTRIPADHSLNLALAELKPPQLSRADRLDKAAEPPGVLASFEGHALAAVADRSASKPPDAEKQQVVAAAYTRRPSAESPDDANAELRSTDTQKLFGFLNDLEIGRAATIELDRRGYSARQIEIGKHLTSPDAEERLRWAELLPGIRGIDARYWLLKLTDDANLQVRRTAVGLLATDADPEVMRRLQQIVIEESDDDIRNQAARSLEMWQSPTAP